MLPWAGRRLAQVAFGGHGMSVPRRPFSDSAPGRSSGARQERKPYVYVDYSHLKTESVYPASPVQSTDNSSASTGRGLTKGHHLSTTKVAIQGCCHGRLDEIYREVSQLERTNKYTIDALLICGDFGAMRNSRDLQCLAAPKWHRKLGDFHKYYTGEKVAPKLTLVIGGNHEASSHMSELFHGGWVAPNIYYLGNANCVQLNGIRIASLSGLFNGQHFKQGYHERVPYDKSTMRSVYHQREFDIRRTSLLSSPRIVLSHEWPQHIVHHGDLPALLQEKPTLEPDIKSGRLGSPPLMGLLETLQPEWWFSAHMHVRFDAKVRHPPPASWPNAPKETRFVGLDRVLRGRPFLDVIDVNSPLPASPPTLSFDPEWLAITRAFHPWHSRTLTQRAFPPEHQARSMVAKELEWVKTNLKTDERLLLVDDVQKFEMTAPGPCEATENPPGKFEQPPYYPSPQTKAFCEMLDIDNKIN